MYINRLISILSSAPGSMRGGLLTMVTSNYIEGSALAKILDYGEVMHSRKIGSKFFGQEISKIIIQ